MAQEQYNEMTIEQKAAMFDEIQEAFIDRDGNPFTKDDVDVYYNLVCGYNEAIKYDCATFLIHELTEHLHTLHFANMAENKFLCFENTEQLIKAFAYFSEADSRVRYRLHQS